MPTGAQIVSVATAVPENRWSQQEILARATHPDEPLVSFQSPESSLIRAALSGVERTDLRDAGPGEVIRGAVPIRSTFQPSDVDNELDSRCHVLANHVDRQFKTGHGNHHFQAVQSVAGAVGMNGR